MTNANIDLLDSVEASSHAITDVLKILSVDRDRGLPASEIERRRQQYGWNRLQQLKRRSNWQIALEQFKSPIVGLLAVAAILSFSFQEWVEGIAILIAILLNAGIGFVTEVKAVNSMESLQRLSRTYAKVRRDGRVQEIPSEEIVLGDIVVFEGGDLVPADLRILEASKLQADESALTGESVPVSKTADTLERDLPLAERTNMLFKMSQQDRDYWQERGDRMARDGLRILALAEKTVDNPDAPAYEQLTFLGILGLLDPPRQDAKAAIKECQQAGIRVIMLTGDQPIAARQIGLAVGLTSEQEAEARLGKELKNPDELSDQEKLQLRQVPIFARVSPEQKLNLIAIHQQAGAVVAMTGDGVNDAPALKKADIGIAMGKRGTQVAREAADMVLQDDAFSTIVAAIEQGRAIFANIRKFTLYLLSGNTGQIIAVAVASIANLPLPLFPLQILFINAVNDVFPALALGVGEGNPQQMKHPPRPSHEPILTRRHWGAIAGYGIIIAATILGVFIFSLRVLGLEERRAVTISFLTLAFTRLWHVFNMRDSDSRLFRNEITQNRFIWLALLICTGLILIAVYVPFIAQVLLIDPPSLEQWGLILGMSTIPLLIIQIWKLFKNRKFRRIAV